MINLVSFHFKYNADKYDNFVVQHVFFSVHSTRLSFKGLLKDKYILNINPVKISEGVYEIVATGVLKDKYILHI